MSHRTFRWGALVAASALGLSGLALVAPAQATPTHDPRPATIGASWLAGQLGSDHLLPGDFGPLYGPSIDAALSLTTVGGQATAVTSIRDAVAAAVQNADYITGEAFGDTGSTYAGAVAKSAVLAEATGGTVTSFGGVNLVTRLEAQVSASSPVAGRLFDTSAYGDYANTLGQAFAARALSVAGSAKASDVLGFLLEQQCTAGFFRVSMTTDKTAVDQSCEGAVGSAASAPDTDATAIAVEELSAIPSPTPAITDALSAAATWLLAAQHTDGSFGGGTSTSAPNSDSTGLAGAALAILGHGSEASKAAIWVRMHQADELPGCVNGLSGQTGAIGYDDAAVAGARAGAIGSAGQQWRIAAAQALPVLQFAPAGTPAPALSGPTGFAKAGSTATYHVSGVVPGDKVCVRAFGTGHTVVGGLSGSADLRLTYPAGTAKRTVRVTDRSPSTASVSTQVLGAKVLGVSAKSTVRAGTRLTVTVTGLKPGESVVLNLRGVRVRTGVANADGVFVGRFIVRRPLGRANLVAWGEYPTIRRGSTAVQIVG